MENECIAVSSSGKRCNGLIGVPITFLDKYNPEQFEIIGGFNGSNLNRKLIDGYVPSIDTPVIVKGRETIWNGPTINKKAVYYRIIIRKRNI